MEVPEELNNKPKCYNIKESLLGKLNIVQNKSGEPTVLWNRYQIFLYENTNFQSPDKIFIPEFQIKKVLLTSDYLLCLDTTSNMHITSLNFKSVGQKRFKSSFQPRLLSVLECIKFSSDSILSLKYESGMFTLCHHNIGLCFQLQRAVFLLFDYSSMPNPGSYEEEYIIMCHVISEEEFEYLSTIFNVSIWNNHSLVLFCLDKFTVYACLFSPKDSDEELSLKELYCSPTEICDLKVVDHNGLNILIGLKCGTLINLPLKSNNRTPEIIHLNIALSKFIIKSRDSLIYTDCKTMWTAENVLSKDIRFQKLLVKDVKDFIKIKNLLICTTFTNMIYIFPIENETSISDTEDEYCSAEVVLNNVECLHKIKQEIKKNEEIISKINDEGSHLTTVSLSRRKDIMDQVIQTNILLYEEYREILNEKTACFLTEELLEYSQPDSHLVLLKIAVSTIQHRLCNIVSEILLNIKINITFTTEEKLLKTTMLQLNELLKSIQILIPVQGRNLTKLNVEIELISEIPGPLDGTEKIWTTIYKKDIILNAEHFIKSNLQSNKNISLKENKLNIEDSIHEIAEKQHGSLFKFKDISKIKKHDKEMLFYVKLPSNFKEILSNENTFKSIFSAQKSNYIHKLLSTEEFLKSKTSIVVEIGIEKVSLEILNDDFNNPLLQISSGNLEISYDIRNFFANIFFEDSQNCAKEEHVSNALYTTTENIQKAMKNTSNAEECIKLAENFQKNVIATLPM